MNTLAVSEVVQENRSAPSLLAVGEKQVENEQGILDRHPLVPIFIAGIIAVAVSSAMIGSIVQWLALGHSGFMAP